MRISALIKKLQDYQLKHGDVVLRRKYDDGLSTEYPTLVSVFLGTAIHWNGHKYPHVIEV